MNCELVSETERWSDGPEPAAVVVEVPVYRREVGLWEHRKHFVKLVSLGKTHTRRLRFLGYARKPMEHPPTSRVTSIRQPALALLVLLGFPPSHAAEHSLVLDAMQAELNRSMRVLGEQADPPYYMGYEVTERDRAFARGSFGALVSSNRDRDRYLDVDLRVGSHALDNTRAIRGGGDFSGRDFAKLPVEDDADAIRARIWKETDQHYKNAVERLTKVKADVNVKVEAEDASADFSREKPVEHMGESTPLTVRLPDWEAKVRRYTAPFAEHGDIYRANARLSAVVETRWLVNSEGTRVRTSETRYRLSITASTKAEDGMTLPLYESFAAFSEAALPSDEAVLRLVAGMIANLKALRTAPVVDPYTGPAILAGRASGVFFHEILGHRVEGHRQKRTDEGQTFKKKIGERILPEGFGVAFDPTRRSLAGSDLSGAYRFDNQGVPAQRVAVVENGIFKRFLMSRTPIEGFSNSNGHGRKEPGYMPVSRQSNLLVEVAKPVGRGALKRMLLAMVAEAGKPFGLLFEDIRGGFTTTGRYAPNAFNVQPILVYRVYPDGREELVRGVDLIGTPLATLSRVVAGDDQLAVFNGTCGAESGGVPVAAASPSVLVSQIEVQKKTKSQDRLPVLPPPFGDSSAEHSDAAAG